MTFFLSALPLMFYGENITVIMLIVISYAIVSAIGLLISSKMGTTLMWFLIFGASIGAYLIDIGLIAAHRLIKMEPYPLVIGQIYILPIYMITTGMICILGRFIWKDKH